MFCSFISENNKLFVLFCNCHGYRSGEVSEFAWHNQEIDNFNKKSLYLLIREMTGVNTVHITKIINEMKKHYKRLANEFSLNGSLIRLVDHSTFFKM